jgi:hypothetical protein
MSRNPRAALSPGEVNALRRVASGLANFLAPNHRHLLISMGLITLTLGGHLVLTEEGRQRLANVALGDRPSARPTTPPKK